MVAYVGFVAMTNVTQGVAQQSAEDAVVIARSALGIGDRPPFLQRAEPWVNVNAVGLAYAGNDGTRCKAGQADVPFSLQSLSKVFALCLALSLYGPELWRDLGYRAVDHEYDSMSGFDSRVHPPNPLFNAGALIVVDRLISLLDAAALPVREMIEGAGDWCVSSIDDERQRASDKKIRLVENVWLDEHVAEIELASAYRNRAIVSSLAHDRAIRNDPNYVLKEYTRLCALRACCVTVANRAHFLSSLGWGRFGGAVLAPSEIRRVNGLLTLSGTYNNSARTLFDIGLPIKSGVGGGLIAVMPGRGVVAAWSPRVDEYGTSPGAIRAVGRFAASLEAAGMRV